MDFSDFGKNVTYRDSKRWVYNVVFSENFTNIIDGTITIESDFGWNFKDYFNSSTFNYTEYRPIRIH